MNQKKTIYKHPILRTIIGGALAAAIVLSPSVSFAKDNGKNEDRGNKKIEARGNDKNKHEDNDEDRDENNNRGDERRDGCFRAFGHFVAPGWIKKNGNLELNDGCKLPFGIHKKLKNHGTTTPDTIAPVISDLHVNAGVRRAGIIWKTNEKADSAVFFSSTTPVSTATSSTSRFDKEKDTNHRIVLRKLNPNTTYYVIVRSKDKAGNTTYSGQISFTTKNGTSTPDTIAPVISNINTTAGTSTIGVSWNTNEVATSRVFYSTSSSVNTSTSTGTFVENTALTTGHSLTISGLSTSTTYYLVIESTDALDNTTRSATLTRATNAPADTTAPVISNIVTTAASTSVSLSWTTNESSNSKIYYGTGSPLNLGSASSVTNSSLVTNHNLTVNGLGTSTQYYFVIESKDASNNTATSSQISTTTLAL